MESITKEGVEKPKINVPHFKGIIKQKRASGYTFSKCFYDIIDNIIGKSDIIYVKLHYNDEKKLLSISFTDKYEKGFENLNESNYKNPFNPVTKIRDITPVNHNCK